MTLPSPKIHDGRTSVWRFRLPHHSSNFDGRRQFRPAVCMPRQRQQIFFAYSSILLALLYLILTKMTTPLLPPVIRQIRIKTCSLSRKRTLDRSSITAKAPKTFQKMKSSRAKESTGLSPTNIRRSIPPQRLWHRPPQPLLLGIPACTANQHHRSNSSNSASRQ